MLHSILDTMATAMSMQARTNEADWARHIFRELNGEADTLANRHAHTFSLHACPKPCLAFQVFFDGSSSPSGCGCGLVLFGAESIIADVLAESNRIAEMSFQLAFEATIKWRLR